MTISNNPRQELIAMHFEQMFNKWGANQPPRSGLHASAVLVPDGEWCVRRHVLSALYPDDIQPPETTAWSSHQNAIFLNGWALHKKWQSLFEQFGKCLEVEQPHYDAERELHFTPDAIIEFGGTQYVVEIKGYKQEMYSTLDTAGEPPEAAMLQANLYMHLLGIQQAIILVENKNTQDFKVWVTEYDMELVKEYLYRIYKVKGAVIQASAALRLPSRICSSRQVRIACKCPMRNKCFSMEE